MRVARDCRPWCRRHVSQLRGGEFFFIDGALRPVLPTWSRPLQLVARNARWLRSLRPPDIAGFDKAFQAEVKASSSGGMLSKAALLRLFVVAFLKDPAAVSMWARATEDLRSPQADCTPKELAKAARSLRILEGHVDSLPTAGAETLPLSERVRMLLPPEEPVLGQKRKIDDQKRCVWQALWQTGVETLRVPTTHEAFCETVAALDAWLASFPGEFLHGQGASQKGSMHRKAICRKFALSFAARLPKEARGMITIAELAPASPDVDGHVSGAFGGGVRWQEVQAAIGVDPLLAACWCCLMSVLPAELQKEFEDTSGKITGILAQLEASGEAVSLKTIAEALSS